MITRYYGIYDLEGISSSDFDPLDLPSVTDKDEDVSVVYTSDHAVSVTRTITVEEGVHYYEYQWVHRDSEEVLGSIRWQTFVEGSDRFLYVWDGSQWELENSSLGSEVELESAIAPAVGEEGLGTYDVFEIKSVEGESGPEVVSTTNLASHDIRALLLKNVRADKPRFQPDSNESTTTLRADVYALPVTSDLSGNWAPTEDVPWKLDLFQRNSNEPDKLIEAGFTDALEVSYSNGLLNDIAQVWDGIRLRDNQDDELVEGQFFGTFSAIAETGEPGNIWSGFATCDGISYRCRCHTNRMNGRLHIQVPLGPGFPALTYDSFAHEQAASSLGSGWSTLGSARLFVDGNKLVYRAEGGAFLRWTWTGSAYESFFPDNPNNLIEAEKRTTSPDTYRLTFPDQSVRDFDENLRLERDADRNGNEITYVYNQSGHIESLSDGRGRSLHYLYGSRTDGQPTALLLNDDDPQTARKCEFTYYSDQHPDSPSRLETLTNPAGEVLKFVYYPDGPIQEIIQVKESTDEIVLVSYTYDELGRLDTEERNGELRLTYQYWVEFAT